jgi:purine nucleosidase/pyrimidine-specific ribonucleoside hydrolase
VNARKTLELLNVSGIPVAQGMLTPLVRPYPNDPFSHGADGLGETNLPEPSLPLDPRFAPDLLVELVNRFPGELTLVATGPLTNIAQAIMKDPQLVHKVSHLYMLGGAYGFNEYAYKFATGDNPVSEWNVYVDPEAARLVFRSGIPLTAIGGDVFAHPSINLRHQDIAALQAAGNRESAYMLDLLRFVTQRGFLSYCILIDALAVAAALDPAIFQTKRVHVDVETRGELTLGQTVTDTRANFRWDHLPEIEAAYGADFPRFLDMLVGAIAS